MAENKEAILADFQECTGIEDVGEAIFHLEEENWDLLRAVNRVMPQETQTLPSEMDVDIEMIEEIKHAQPCQVDDDVDVIETQYAVTAPRPFQVPISISADVIPVPSTSRVHNMRLIQFHIIYKDEVIALQMPDTSSVGDVKIMLAARLQVPSCQLELEGWSHTPTSDQDTLLSLRLPRENVLSVTTPDVLIDDESLTEKQKIDDRLSQYFTLSIVDTSIPKPYSLKFLGSKTVLQVKTDVYTLTDIPVRHQLWTGWPVQMKSDSTTLAASGINHPKHDFTVHKNPAAGSSPKEKKVVVNLADSDSSVEEFEDASETFTVEDDIFVDVETKRIQSLIPENNEDEAAGCIHFAEEFANRYGDAHPNFFLGTLDEAIREACTKPAKDRKILAVYLHHDASVLTNVFCTQLLCFDSILHCLAQNFVVWGWDLTHESNKIKFLGTVARTLGGVAAMTIRNMEVERLPAVLVIMKIRSATEIFTVVHGNVGVSELLTSLIQSADVFSEQRRIEMRDEEERSARELVKREQDEAYEESLETDRAKEEAKKHQTMMANRERERKESHKQEMDSIREANRLEVLATLPDEPPDGDGLSIIRVRLPSGEFLTRRFLANTQLQILLNYLLVQGFPSDEYKVISSWPRRDLTSLDSKLTLQELKLYPQETVILEER